MMATNPGPVKQENSVVVQNIKSDSQDETDNSSTLNSTPPKKRKPTSRNQQKYRKAWEHYPEFKAWLESVENNVYKARCKLCCKVLVADLSVLQCHALSLKHIRNVEESDVAKQALDSLSAHGSRRPSEPPSRALFKREHQSRPRFEKLKSKEPSEEISLDSLSIADPHSEGSSFTPEGGYIEPITIDMSQVHHVSTTRKPAEPASFTSKAVVTKPAPPWKATAIVNGHVTRLELNDYKGRYLILFFYPQDFSAVCPTELLALSDRVLEFRALQTEIVACSVDSHLTHLAWARTPRAEGGLGNPKIPLLADPTHSIARDYGILLPDLGHTLRAHFIIDRRGVLRHMQINDLGVGRSIDEMLRITQALQHVDETETGCPVDWKPGMPNV
uniref:thioredoxin-dependent peroxiredoxin n=1 Tax=Graphocephala atropunctata TaxID=36148 RepID=A0A1B6MRD9_9HEMI